MLVGACSSSDADPPPPKLRADMEKLRPLHTQLGKPKSGDWLAEHKEDGQTFAEYVRCTPVRPTASRRTIYVQPLGDFTEPQRRIVTLSADFMGRYFGLPVKTLDVLPLSVIPATARRVHPSWGMKQILSTYVLDDVLGPRLPKDAVAYIAFTTSDLWPGEGWNFVFGQASLRGRVGVWSIYRNGDPAGAEAEFRLCLLRTIKTATHETGHMFSMHHCIRYECNMCGSNHRKESDGKPLALCPECVAKLWWITQADPVARYTALIDFCTTHGLADERTFYERSVKALEAK
ncbi:Zn-dependent protease [bacterium]|nr:Zn-dependent protease [bacterium]